MNRIATLAALIVAAPVYSQQAWWTPVPEQIVYSPPMPKAAWWTPCDCGNCGDDDGQKKAYADAYDRAIKENKPLVLFVGCAPRPVKDAIVVRYDKAELPVGTKLPAVFVGRGCNGETLNRTALLAGDCTERQLHDAIRQQPVCPTCPQQTPFRIGQAEPELNGVAGLMAAAMIGVIEGATDAKTQTPYTSIVSAPFASSFRGDGEAVYFEARRFRTPVRRLFALPFRAIRSLRANRTELVSVEPVSTTITRYETVPVAQYTLTPVIESVPVTRYRWVETPAMPKK